MWSQKSPRYELHGVGPKASSHDLHETGKDLSRAHRSFGGPWGAGVVLMLAGLVAEDRVTVIWRGLGLW
jgi:hypothetical protein